VLSITNVVLHLFVFLDYITVHNISLTSKSMRRNIAHAHSERYLNLLRPYVMTNGGNFVDAIENNNGVIVGSAALSLVQPAHHWQPRDLNIVVSRGHALSLCLFLQSNGFLNIQNATPQFDESWSRTSAFSHHRLSHCQNAGQCITITESIDDTVLTVILASVSTSEMMFVTYYGIFMAHPRFTFRGLAFRTLFRVNAEISNFKAKRCSEMDLMPIRHTSGKKSACNRDCPIIWRSIDDYKNILLVDWTYEGREEETGPKKPRYHIRDCKYRWRLALECHNPWCALRIYHIPDVLHGPSDLNEIVSTKETLTGHPVYIFGSYGIAN